jgi:hypothetical protein
MESGVQSLAMLIPMVAAAILSGLLIRQVGYYTPVTIVGNCFAIIGAGLMTTLQVDMKQANWVGYQILYGFGLGCCQQGPTLAAQTVLKKRDIPVGSSLMLFSNLFGSAIFAAVGQSILNHELSSNLSHLPGFSNEELQRAGATSMVDLPDSVKAEVLPGYNKAIQRVFLAGLIMNCVSLLGASAMEWKSTKKMGAEVKPESGA